MAVTEEDDTGDFGYPDADTLQRLRTWPVKDLTGALDFLHASWITTCGSATEVLFPDERRMAMARPGDRHLRLATGGWSGNETLLAAFQKNRVLYFLSWRLSACGGLHIFRYPRETGRP